MKPMKNDKNVIYMHIPSPTLEKSTQATMRLRIRHGNLTVNEIHEALE